MSTLRIAMWSGPRNISTAMMRAFENRPDTEVWDEPLYGHYLYKTGIAHPGAAEVIADQGVDWRRITQRCCNGAPNHARVFYQKHMAMHLLPEMSTDWLTPLTNCFLIRPPDQVIASYCVVRPNLTLEDIGFVQQANIYQYIIQNSHAQPIIIDSTEFLDNPEAMLRRMCQRLQIDFLPQMLKWPAGARKTDGVWGQYWYDSVWKSSCFAPSAQRPFTLSKQMQNIADKALPFYQMLYEKRLTL